MAEYKIKDIEALTGIKAHTLRIWEKRYELLVPERTDTQIRTYTDAELTFLLNISLLNKSGYKISKIAKLSSQEIAELVWEIKVSTSLDNSGEKLILALIHLNESLFRDTLNDLIEEVGLEDTFSNHLIPFLDRIGVMWLVGTITPAQEHFISNLIRQKVIAEIDKLAIPNPTDAPIMLYLPEHEWHELGLLYYQFLLRKKGLHTVYLGQSLPYDSTIDCIKRLNPSAIITSWLTAVDDEFLIKYFEQLIADSNNKPIYAGGAQINMKITLLDKKIIEIKNAKDLKTLF
jgi:DNA-binding transcriptional MerR regulator